MPGWELIVVLIIALLLFGSRLPDIARSLGGTIKEFKKGMEEGVKETDKEEKKPAESPSSKDSPSPADSENPSPRESDTEVQK